MGFSSIGLRHIVDVDGQLLGFEAGVVDPASILERANRPNGTQLWMVRAGERFALHPREKIRLSEDDVLFFETSNRIGWWPQNELMAA